MIDVELDLHAISKDEGYTFATIYAVPLWGKTIFATPPNFASIKLKQERFVRRLLVRNEIKWPSFE